MTEEVISVETPTDTVQDSVSDFSQHLLMIEEQLTSDPDNQTLISVRNDILEFLELANPQATDSTREVSSETETQFVVGDKYSIQCASYAGDLATRNCIIMELDSSTDSATVLFTQPTDESMVPCHYFLDGSCKFGLECRRSHGYRVDTSLLETYEHTDMSEAQEDSACLVYCEDSCIWTQGIILDKVDSTCEVWLEKFNEKVQVPIDEIFLLKTHPREELHSSGEDSEYEYRTIPVLPTTPDNSGSVREVFWEKHTRGIGSKLMSKMGYIPGAGLGIEGSGMRDPVEIVVLPKRRSLDHCMESKRNSSDNKNRKKPVKKKYTKRNEVKNYSNDSFNLDVFDFLNNSIHLQQLVHSEISRESAQVSMNSSARKDTNGLDISGGRRVQLDKQLRDARTEADKLRLSLSRNRKDPVIAKQIEIKLKRAERDLSLLQQEESSILSRLNSQKKRASMSVF